MPLRERRRAIGCVDGLFCQPSEFRIGVPTEIEQAESGLAPVTDRCRAWVLSENVVVRVELSSRHAVNVCSRLEFFYFDLNTDAP